MSRNQRSQRRTVRLIGHVSYLSLLVAAIKAETWLLVIKELVRVTQNGNIHWQYAIGSDASTGSACFFWFKVSCMFVQPALLLSPQCSKWRSHLAT